MSKTNNKTRSGLIRLALAMMIAFAFLGLFSKNSFLYPINDWVDENCFFTVGRAMLEGKVPYRDLCEQKGPVVYFVFALAAIISKTSFFGVFIIEWLLFAAFLYAASGFLLLYRPRSVALSCVLQMLLLAFSITISKSFSHGGSVEEFCLFMPALSLLIVLGAIKRNETVKRIDAFFIGVFAAIALWSKFTLSGFYIGLCAGYSVYLMRRKAPMELIKSILLFLIGALTATLPIIAYFSINNSVTDLLETYFGYNILLYPKTEGGASGIIAPLVNVAKGLATAAYANGLCSAIFGIGAFRWIKRRGRGGEALVILASFFALAVTTFIGGKSRYSYYALILDCFAPLGAAAVIDILRKNVPAIVKIKPKLRALPVSAFAVLLLAGGLVMSKNTYLIKYEKADMPQYKFAETIRNKPGSTLLNYGFLDGGFYFAAERTPTCKYFCKLNLKLDEMDVEQRRMIEERRVDFIITRGKKLEGSRLDSSGYELIDSAALPFEGINFVYYLYGLRSAD